MVLMLLLISNTNLADPCISPSPSVKWLQQLHLPPLWAVLKDSEGIVLQPNMIFSHTISAQNCPPYTACKLNPICI